MLCFFPYRRRRADRRLLRWIRAASSLSSWLCDDEVEAVLSRLDDEASSWAATTSNIALQGSDVSEALHSLPSPACIFQPIATPLGTECSRQTAFDSNRPNNVTHVTSDRSPNLLEHMETDPAPTPTYKDFHELKWFQQVCRSFDARQQSLEGHRELAADASASPPGHRELEVIEALPFGPVPTAEEVLSDDPRPEEWHKWTEPNVVDWNAGVNTRSQNDNLDYTSSQWEVNSAASSRSDWGTPASVAPTWAAISTANWAANCAASSAASSQAKWAASPEYLMLDHGPHSVMSELKSSADQEVEDLLRPLLRFPLESCQAKCSGRCWTSLRQMVLKLVKGAKSHSSSRERLFRPFISLFERLGRSSGDDCKYCGFLNTPEAPWHMEGTASPTAQSLLSLSQICVRYLEAANGDGPAQLVSWMARYWQFLSTTPLWKTYHITPLTHLCSLLVKIQTIPRSITSHSSNSFGRQDGTRKRPFPCSSSDIDECLDCSAEVAWCAYRLRRLCAHSAENFPKQLHAQLTQLIQRLIRKDGDNDPQKKRQKNEEITLFAESEALLAKTAGPTVPAATTAALTALTEIPAGPTVPVATTAALTALTDITTAETTAAEKRVEATDLSPNRTGLDEVAKSTTLHWVRERVILMVTSTSPFCPKCFDRLEKVMSDLAEIMEVNKKERRVGERLLFEPCVLFQNLRYHSHGACGLCGFFEVGNELLMTNLKSMPVETMTRFFSVCATYAKLFGSFSCLRLVNWWQSGRSILTLRASASTIDRASVSTTGPSPQDLEVLTELFTFLVEIHTLIHIAKRSLVGSGRRKDRTERLLRIRLKNTICRSDRLTNMISLAGQWRRSLSGSTMSLYKDLYSLLSQLVPILEEEEQRVLERRSQGFLMAAEAETEHCRSGRSMIIIERRKSKDGSGVERGGGLSDLCSDALSESESLAHPLGIVCESRNELDLRGEKELVSKCRKMSARRFPTQELHRDLFGILAQLIVTTRSELANQVFFPMVNCNGGCKQVVEALKKEVEGRDSKDDSLHFSSLLRVLVKRSGTHCEVCKIFGKDRDPWRWSMRRLSAANRLEFINSCDMHIRLLGEDSVQDLCNWLPAWWRLVRESELLGVDTANLFLLLCRSIIDIQITIRASQMDTRTEDVQEIAQGWIPQIRAGDATALLPAFCRELIRIASASPSKPFYNQLEKLLRSILPRLTFNINPPSPFVTLPLKRFERFKSIFYSIEQARTLFLIAVKILRYRRPLLKEENEERRNEVLAEAANVIFHALQLERPFLLKLFATVSGPSSTKCD